jgi:hypothetical protein
MTLHLTSCHRADFSATEARDLAREVAYQEIELNEWRAGEYVTIRDHRVEVVVAALQAFG